MSSDYRHNCIVSQVHIPDFDPQGSLTSEQKLRIVEFGLEHLRAFNPNSYIIMTGHGHRPRNLSLCDFHDWNDTPEPLNEHGYVVGMPAQYKYVHKGLQHAFDRGFDRCLKTRGDCIIGIPNITEHCHQILGGKTMLITQQTGVERMGDCFMFGDTVPMWATWHADNPVVCAHDGLQNTAANYRKAIGRPTDDWKSLLRETCEFRDVDLLKFTCLRWNYRQLDELSESTRRKLLDPSFPFDKYHWGKANNWHHFDANRNMSKSIYWSQKEFYA